MTIFNGSSSVLAFGPIWEQQNINFIVSGLECRALSLAGAGLVVLEFNSQGNDTQVPVVAPEGTLKLGAKLPRPIGKTCVMIEYNKGCCTI